MLNPAALKQMVEDSLTARSQQGYDVSKLKQAFREVCERRETASVEEWIALYRRIADAPPMMEFPYHEPNELAEIRSLRPDGPRVMNYSLTDLELRDKIHGALLGRICGVVLGRPVEHAPLERITRYLNVSGAYPLRDYFSRKSKSLEDGSIVDEINYERLRCTMEYLEFAEADDDINYVFLALKLLEKIGTNFTTLDIGYNWLDNYQANWMWGPERTAYLNLARYTETWPRYLEIDEKTLWEISHDLNGYSELIGAQIRGDLFGYIAAGLPELAADFAYRDASFTHIKNGIYGEMFVSAMIAAAFCTNDIREIIRIGLSEIPAVSRLSEAIRSTVNWHEELRGDWMKVLERIHTNYEQYSQGGTINNAAVVVNALLSGRGDFEQTICIAVMQGLDTDCNAATAGSIVGILCGASTLPDKWTKPLNDTVMSTVVGESRNTISGTAERIFHIARMVTKNNRKIRYRYSEPE